MTVSTASLQADNYKGPTGIDDITVAANGPAADYLEALYHQGQVESVLTANAIAVDLTKDSVVAANPQRLVGGGFWVTMQPRGSDVFLRLRPVSSNPATTITAASTGLKLLDGQTYNFFITTNERYADVRSTANCSLYWWRSSERTDRRGA